ncbi:MAG: 5'-methylthioadenosine phosphorylase [Myxococcota bacterium]|jgi:5'-methylthioadenosine phosphorylase
MQRIGVIGGSGLYEMDGVEVVGEITVDTPYGSPSDAIVHVRMDGADVYFLPRHGRGHRYLPSEVPYRANIWALKSLGVTWVVSVSAVGSLVEEIEPGGNIVLVDQFIDRTSGRDKTFFGDGVVAHISFGEPVCGVLHGYLETACKQLDAKLHTAGTYVCIDGPAFSTRAESNWFRSMGATVVGMTNLPEARLAREAEMSYVTVALPTDYDCWHDGHDDVSVEQIIATLMANVGLGKSLIRAVVPLIAAHEGPAPFTGSLASALFTPRENISAERWEDLAPLFGESA